MEQTNTGQEQASKPTATAKPRIEVKVEHGYAGNNEPNNYILTIGKMSIWFSYETPVAFCGGNIGDVVVCRQNEWSTTTGKHLNAIMPNKKARITGEEFTKQLNAMLEKHGFQVV